MKHNEYDSDDASGEKMPSSGSESEFDTQSPSISDPRFRNEIFKEISGSQTCLNLFGKLLTIKKQKNETLASLIGITPESSPNTPQYIESLEIKLKACAEAIEDDNQFLSDFCDNIFEKLKNNFQVLKVAEREIEKHEGIIDVYRERLTNFEKLNRFLKREVSKQEILASNTYRKYEKQIKEIREQAQLDNKVHIKFNSSNVGVCEAYTLYHISKKAYYFVKNILEYPLPTHNELELKAKDMSLRSAIIDEIINEMKLKASTMEMTEKERLCSLHFFSFKPNKDIVDCDLFSTGNNVVRIIIGMAQSIYDTWKQPIYIEFNKPLTVETIHLNINKLHETGFRVLTLTTEYSEHNIELWRELGISHTRPYFVSHSGKYIHLVPDIFNLYEELGNHYKLINNDAEKYIRTIRTGPDRTKVDNSQEVLQYLITNLNACKNADNCTDEYLLPFKPYFSLIQSLCFVLKASGKRNAFETIKFEGISVDFSNDQQRTILTNFLYELLCKDANELPKTGNLHFAIGLARNSVKILTTICKTFRWPILRKLSLTSIKNVAINLVKLFKNIESTSVVTILYCARSYLTDPTWRMNFTDQYLTFNTPANVQKYTKAVINLNTLPVEMKSIKVMDKFKRKNTCNRKNESSNIRKNVVKISDLDFLSQSNKNAPPVDTPLKKISDDVGKNIAKQLSRLLATQTITASVPAKQENIEHFKESLIETAVAPTNANENQNLVEEIDNNKKSSCNPIANLADQIKASIIGNAVSDSKPETETNTPLVNQVEIHEKNPTALSKNLSIKTLCIKNIQTVYKKNLNEEEPTLTNPVNQNISIEEKVSKCSSILKRSLELLPNANLTIKKLKTSVPVSNVMSVNQNNGSSQKINVSIVGKTKDSDGNKRQSMPKKTIKSKETTPSTSNSLKPNILKSNRKSPTPFVSIPSILKSSYKKKSSARTTTQTSSTGSNPLQSSTSLSLKNLTSTSSQNLPALPKFVEVPSTSIEPKKELGFDQRIDVSQLLKDNMEAITECDPLNVETKQENSDFEMYDVDEKTRRELAFLSKDISCTIKEDTDHDSHDHYDDNSDSVFDDDYYFDEDDYDDNGKGVNDYKNIVSVKGDDALNNHNYAKKGKDSSKDNIRYTDEESDD